MNSLGFDTLVVNARPYTDQAINMLIDIFSPLDVKYFIFIHDFDPVTDSLPLAIDSARKFEQHLSQSLPRGVHGKALLSVRFSNETVITPQIRRLCVSHKVSSLFVSLPLFIDPADNDFAVALNRLLYRSAINPIFNSFDTVIETAPEQFSHKLLEINSCSFAFDINYLLRLDNHKLSSLLAARNVSILPCISHDPSCYVGIAKDAQLFIDTFGKQLYYKLCSQINKCVFRAGL